MAVENKETPRTIKTFALASFLNDMGSDMIYPIWPMFVTSFLGANMAVLGLIDGLGEALVSLSQAASGYISDRIKRRKAFIWTGYLFATLSRIGYAFSTTWQHLIPFRILDRAGKIRGAPRDAMVADLSVRENRGRHFGILRAMDNLGAVCGIVLCILLFDALGYKKLLLLAAIPSVVATLLIIAAIKEKKPPELKLFKGLALKDLDRNFRLFLVLSLFFALGSFSYSFLLLYAKHLGFKASAVPVLYLIFSIVASLLSLPFGRLADRAGRKPVLLLSFVFWASVCLSFLFARGRFSVALVFVLYGLHKAALDPVQRAFVSELAPAPYRASSLGGFQMVVGLCALPASLIAGFLWEKVDSSAPFLVSLGLTLAAIFLLLFVHERAGESETPVDKIKKMG